jgi:diaminopimelate decarboxylase
MASALQYLSSDRTASPNQLLMPVTAQVNGRDHLEVGGCDVQDLVVQYGSPLYILDEAGLRSACSQYREALGRHYGGPALAIYASKAWNCLAICAIVANEGLGIDVVSAGELYTAQKAGVPAHLTYFHGNNKSREELSQAIEAGVTVVVDNWLELDTLAELAAAAGVLQRVMLRLTPGIECHTHDYIRTGHLDSKFGFDPEQMQDLFAAVKAKASLSCIGLHAHIGSQIFELQPHQDLGDVLAQAFVDGLAVGLPLAELNVGGGLGIRYTESDDPPSIDLWVEKVAGAVAAACDRRNLPLPKLICEPGRSLVGSSCVTAYRVGGQKTVPGIRTYITVDGGMSDNPRPITYQSKYRSLIATKMSAPLSEIVTVAGKHCESGDVLIHDAPLPKTEPGDLLVVLATGAYNYSMASNYNRLPRPAAVLVGNGKAELILQRETLVDLLRSDVLPDRLTQA